MFEIFENLPRQGPGDSRSTQKAFQMLDMLPDNPEILDIGCGGGSQTFDLAGLTSGRITAVDNHVPFLEMVKLKAQSKQYSAEITTIQGDMAALNFQPENFDLIWSEGAAYIMGFTNALNQWRNLLRPTGFMVISEIVWFQKKQPQELQDYWATECPEIKYYEDNFPIIENAGYKLIGYFPLPDKSWWSDYYHPLEQQLITMRKEYHGNTQAEELFDSFQAEIELHRKYSDFYGYGFFIMQRND